jgi:hypothetical protein
MPSMIIAVPRIRDGYLVMASSLVKFVSRMKRPSGYINADSRNLQGLKFHGEPSSG